MEKSAGVFIFNHKNELLICHPTGFGLHANWSIPKGKIDDNETPIQAAIRETLEESNIDILKYGSLNDINYIGTQKYKNRGKIIVGYTFKFNVNIEFDLKCNSIVSLYDNSGKINRNAGKLENDIVKFVSIKEALNLLHEAQIELLKTLI